MANISEDGEAIRNLLTDAIRIAVVGCSPKPHRDSHMIAQYLIDAGYEVIPVNPGQDEILGRKCFPDVASIPDPVDIVDIFRSPDHVPPVIEDAVAANAPCVWLQLGVGNPDAEQSAVDAGMTVVTEKCIKVAHTVLRVPKK